MAKAAARSIALRGLDITVVGTCCCDCSNSAGDEGPVGWHADLSVTGKKRRAVKQKQLKAANRRRSRELSAARVQGYWIKYTPFLSLSLVMAHFTDLRAVLPRKRWGPMAWRMAEIWRRMATKSPPELSHWYEVHHTRVTCHVGVICVFSD